jgi:hypothetical protein
MPPSPSGNRNTFYQYWRPVTGIRESDPAPAQPALAMEIPRPLAIQAFRHLAHRQAT